AEKNAARGRRRQSRLVYEAPAPRSRTRAYVCLWPQSQAQLAARVRASVRDLRRDVSVSPVQQELRTPSRLLLRAVPSGRRFRRDLRSLADAGTGLAQQIRRLEGAR